VIEILENTAHVHLLLNHVPTIGFGIGLLLFLAGLVAKSDVLKRTSFVMFFIVAVVAIATYVSGSAAEAVIIGTGRTDFPPGVSPAAIRVHEDAALLAFASMELTGFFAWLALWQWRRVSSASRLPGWNMPIVLLLSLVTFGLMARAAELGGEINHPELREGGLKQGDVIQSFNGQPVTSDDSLRALAAAAPSGSTASIGVVRDGRPRTVAIEIVDAAAAARRASRTTDAAALGVRLIQPLTQELAAQFGLKPGAEGLLVAQVYEQGAQGPAEAGTARAIGAWVTSVTWVWPTAETLHFVGLCMLFTVVVIVDLRMLGMVRSVPYSAVYQLLPIGMLGFGLNLITGILFFLGVPSQYVKNPVFYWKMVFVVLGGLNILYFMLVDEAWSVGPGQDAPFSAKVAAASAIVIWACVLFCGHMLPFIGNSF
jgi:membrane-associated protease RseP (regulator of RpoE activity)